MAEDWDDTVCFECGRSLVIHGREPYEDQGFCDRSCKNGRTGVHGLYQLADLLGCDRREESIRRFVYKNTDCGASFNAVDGGVEVAGYVEGDDFGECELRELGYPFHIDDFWANLSEADAEAGARWAELNPPRGLELMEESIEELARVPEPEAPGS